MRSIGKWLARTIGTALAILLSVVLLPYVSRLAEQFLPDLSDRALKASVTLSRQMEQSARLEVSQLHEEGVVTSSTDALLLGTVQQVSVQYTYQASIGIDLMKVSLKPRGSTLTIVLPEPEVLSDSITPITIERDDFWYPVTDKQITSLLENEKLRRREECIADYIASGQSWEQLCHVMDQTIALWLGEQSKLRIVYEKYVTP